MILLFAISTLSILGFGIVFWKTGIASVADGAMKQSFSGLSAMLDSELTDDAKEIAVRRAGLGLIGAALDLTWRIALALGAAALPIAVADFIGLAPAQDVLSLMMRWDYLLGVSLGAILVAWVIRRARGGSSETASAVNRYSPADRFFHMLAFANPTVLKSLSALEDRIVSKPLNTPAAPPVFITSLARGGTTALLNAFHDMPGIVTHTYRDMPFLTAPILWTNLAKGRRRNVERHERAHGDGLEIDLDTPEALEEVIWKLFWPDKYRGATITTWEEQESKPQADRFLDRHMAKLIRARQGENGTGRYCSKNNANIARIPYLVLAFPGCRIVVPIRRPECHAASLLRQHRNFLELQEKDDFIKRYMRDIGHFEFGQLHKPIAFPGFDATAHDPMTPDYWLACWIHAFEEVLRHREHCIFVPQDDLRATPETVMTELCTRLDLSPGDMRFRDYFHDAPDEAPVDVHDAQLHERAMRIYSECTASAAGRSAP